MQKGSKLYSLEALSSDPLATRNTILFAALTAMGVPPDPVLCGEFVEEKSGQPHHVTVWRLKETSLCGKYQTADLIALFNDPALLETQPEHPLAYIKAAFDNHRRAVEFIKDQGPIAMRRRGKKIGFISRHTSPEHRRKILDELNK
jgi:hypothetical protein